MAVVGQVQRLKRKKKKASLQKEDEGSRHPDRNGYKLQIQRDNGECLGSEELLVTDQVSCKVQLGVLLFGFVLILSINSSQFKLGWVCFSVLQPTFPRMKMLVMSDGVRDNIC